MKNALLIDTERHNVFNTSLLFEKKIMILRQVYPKTLVIRNDFYHQHVYLLVQGKLHIKRKDLG